MKSWQCKKIENGHVFERLLAYETITGCINVTTEIVSSPEELSI